MVTLDQAGWKRATVVILPAPAPVRHVVDFLWIDERPRLSPRCHQWRIVADDAPHIIYYRYSDPVARTDRHRLNVVGARHRYVDVDCSHRLVTVGARLKPGALPALFGVSAHELTNRSVPAQLLVRSTADPLSRLEDATARDATHHIATLVAELTARGRAIDIRARRVADAHANDTRTIRNIAEEMGVGDRALRAWSAVHLGLGLRRFMSIRRLHRAIEARLSHADRTWSSIAASAGFADQPHLVRDCQALLGESPGEFLARAS